MRIHSRTVVVRNSEAEHALVVRCTLAAPADAGTPSPDGLCSRSWQRRICVKTVATCISVECRGWKSDRCRPC